MRSAAKYIWIIIVVTFVGGFLLVETSGLLGRGAVTTTTPVASVNGEKILVTAWQNAITRLEQQQSQQLGRGLTLDERAQLEEQAFNELVTDVLLKQEYARRGITVSDDEVVRAAQTQPPPELMQNPELQTNGQFDPVKYQRFLSNPAARAQGLLVGLENYYRTELPRSKLLEQVAADVYASDERLFQIWRDRNDSAQVSFVALRPETMKDTAITVTDAEIASYYEKNRKLFDQPGRAVLSIVSIPRTVGPADSAFAREKIARLRAEVVGGAKFAEVATRESADSGSAALGGDLGVGPKGRFVPAFEAAMNALAVGEISQPVQTPFGLHLIQVEARKGDSTKVRHILIKVEQSDSTAARTDRRADSLSKLGALADTPAKFDEAAKRLGLTATRVAAIEKEPLTMAGAYVPGASGWAFSGAQAGESSDLFDAPEAYYLARLDSLRPGGQQSLADARDEIRRRLAREKRVQKLLPEGQALASAAQQSTLEAAAAQRGLTVDKTPAFVRIGLVPGLGQYNEAIGAAFGIPVGKVGSAIATRDAVIVMRVDRRVEGTRATFDAQKELQRMQTLRQLRQERVAGYLSALRERARVEDNRKEINSALRRQSGD
jgi:peptidyl-prolyl cis-trans isomerase D